MRPIIFLLLLWLAACGAPNPPPPPPPSMTTPDAGCPLAAGVDGGCGREAETRVPTRDGKELRTFVFLPDAVPDGGAPVLVDRSPYRHLPNYPAFYAATAKYFAARGYAVVIQDCRRDPAFEGVIQPFEHEIADGQDTTKWIKAQPWSNGRIGMMGGSYDGYTAIAAAVDNPDVAAVLADDAPQDYAFERTGGLASTHVLSWMNFLDHEAWLSDADGVTATNGVDLSKLDEQLLKRSDPSYQRFLQTTVQAPFPASGTLVGRYASICAPVLTVSSIGAALDAERMFEHLVAEGCPQHRDDHRFLITPDGHTADFPGPQSHGVATQRMLDFFDHFVAQKPVALPAEQVEFASLGETDYGRVARSAYPGAKAITYQLGWKLGAQLGSLQDLPAMGAMPGTLSVDPATQDPCSTAPGQAYPLLQYVSDPLAEPMRILGDPRLELDVTVSTPDADVFAWLYDYDQANPMTPQFIGTAGVRARYRVPGEDHLLTAGQSVHLSITMGVTAHVVPAGHQLVLGITPGMCGYFENPNTGEPLASQHGQQRSSIVVANGAEAKLLLPVQ